MKELVLDTVYGTVMPMLGGAPQFNLESIGGGQLQTFTRYLAAAIVVIWVFWVAGSYLMPSRRMGQSVKRIGASWFLLLFALAIMIDLSLVDKIIAMVWNILDVLSTLLKQWTGQLSTGTNAG